jgi:hypothetical protein
MTFSDAVERYARNMEAAGLDVTVTEVAPGQVRVSGRVQAYAEHGDELVCTGDEGDHSGRAVTIVFSDPDGVEAARSGPHCRYHADERAESWNTLRDPRRWTATVVETEA